jgi:acetyl esterase/lipase
VIGYFVSIVVIAIPTVLAVAPMRGSWTRGQVSWRLGFQINELPFIAIAWVLANTGFAAWQGDLASPVNASGLLLAALTFAGLCLIVVRGVRAGGAVSDALAVGLGGSWHIRPRSWVRIVLAPLRVGRRDVVRERDLSYGPEGREHLLDTYRSSRGLSNGACLIHFHGGGYRSGEKNREARALLHRLAAQGWFCVSANYRRGRGRSWPDALVDAHRVVAWTRDAVSGLGVDAPEVFVAGSSAGAHLAATTALTPGFGNEREPRLAGVICLYGFYDTPTWIDRDPAAPSSPIDLVDSGAVPFLVAHGSLDSFAPVIGAREFVERLRSVSREPVVYAELPGGQHTFDLYNSPRFDAVICGIEAFTSRVLTTNPR